MLIWVGQYKKVQNVHEKRGSKRRAKYNKAPPSDAKASRFLTLFSTFGAFFGVNLVLNCAQNL